MHGADALVRACRRCFASLFTDRAIAYRIDHGFDHLAVAPVDRASSTWCARTSASSGVMFTLDPDSGFDDVVLIDGQLRPRRDHRPGPGRSRLVLASSSRRWPGGRAPILKRSAGLQGLWKLVSGRTAGRFEATSRPLTPTVAEPVGRRRRVELARAAVAIEAHYSRRRGEPTPMDIEWAKDGTRRAPLHPAGPTGDGASRADDRRRSTCSTLDAHPTPFPLVTGKAVGQKIGVGRARLIRTRTDLAGLPDRRGPRRRQ